MIPRDLLSKVPLAWATREHLTLKVFEVRTDKYAGAEILLLSACKYHNEVNLSTLLYFDICSMRCT